MDYRPPQVQAAASTNKVPKLGIPRTLARSISYPVNARGTQSTGMKGENNDYRQQLKTASTALLNDGRIKPASKAGRSLQNVLMDTEHRLREQRRESLRMRRSK